MAYTNLQLNEAVPTVVKNFVRNQLDMQFADVHCMLRLPIIEADLHAGFNFAAANSLLALVSGISALISPGINTHRQSGDKFKEVLIKYYPWDIQPPVPSDKNIEVVVDHLYQYLRNPLAHTLGLKPAGNFLVTIVKDPMQEAEIVTLEQNDSPSYQAVEYTPVNMNGEQIEQISLYIATFYWGVRKMLTRLTEDTAQMTNTERELLALGLR
jgi:hypothetical protein